MADVQTQTGSIEAHALARHVRMSPQKARLVMDLIRGAKAQDALQTLKYTQKRAAKHIEKVLRSAIANAARPRLPLCAPRWQSRCAALFRCAWRRASVCISASAARPALSARESNPSLAAPSAETFARAAQARELQSIRFVSVRQP